MLDKDRKEDEEDLDFRAVENGFVSLAMSCFLLSFLLITTNHHMIVPSGGNWYYLFLQYERSDYWG